MNKNNVGNAVLANLLNKTYRASNYDKKMAELISISEKSYIKYEDELSIFIEHLMVISNTLNVDVKTLFDTYVNTTIYISIFHYRANCALH